MNLEEVNERLETKITHKQLESLTTLNVLLDLNIDDFCKIINAVGIDKLEKKTEYYEWINKAQMEMVAKKQYLLAKTRLKELESEKAHLERVINKYESKCRQEMGYPF